jgi:carbonic anhydrase
VVLPDVVTAAPAVVDALGEAVEGTARTLQPVNDREVVLLEETAPR